MFQKFQLDLHYSSPYNISLKTFVTQFRLHTRWGADECWRARDCWKIEFTHCLHHWWRTIEKWNDILCTCHVIWLKSIIMLLFCLLIIHRRATLSAFHWVLLRHFLKIFFNFFAVGANPQKNLFNHKWAQLRSFC